MNFQHLIYRSPLYDGPESKRRQQRNTRLPHTHHQQGPEPTSRTCYMWLCEQVVGQSWPNGRCSQLMGNKRHWFGRLLGGAKLLNHWTLVQEQRNWSLSNEDSTFFSDNDLHRNTRPNQTHGNAIITQAQRMLIRRKIILPEDSGKSIFGVWGYERNVKRVNTGSFYDFRTLPGRKILVSKKPSLLSYAGNRSGVR